LHQVCVIRINFDRATGNTVQDLPVHENHWHYIGCRKVIRSSQYCYEPCTETRKFAVAWWKSCVKDLLFLINEIFFLKRENWSANHRNNTFNESLILIIITSYSHGLFYYWDGKGIVIEFKLPTLQQK